jgi:hypothetical protein
MCKTALQYLLTLGISTLDDLVNSTLIQGKCIHLYQKTCLSQVQVAHTCNPSCSGGGDQEDRGSKLAWGNSSARPYLEKTIHKKGLVEWLEV